MRIVLAILLTILACSQCNGLRILGLFPLHGKSHWVMGERLMTALAERGHDVDIVTHFTLKKPLANYHEISLSGTMEPVVNNLNASFIKTVDGQNIHNLVNLAGYQICQLMGQPQLQELIKNRPKYDVILVEIFVAPCYLAFGRHLNAPVVGVITSGFPDWLNGITGNLHNPAFMPGLFTSFSQKMNFWERLMNTILTNLLTMNINYYTSQQSEHVKKYFDINTTIDDLHRDIAAILVNSHHSLNGIKPVSTGIIEVGGLHIKEDADPLPADVQKWLDDSKHGCIFFTFGSMVKIETFPKPLIEAFYKVFEKIAPVRVLMKIAKKEELLPGLPKNVMIKPWFPQVSVFKHKNIKAFITHGGLMSTQEAIYFGIPMVGIPLFGDQRTNVENAANKKITVSLGSIENVTEETLGAAINTILHDETYRKSVKQLSVLFKDRPMQPIDTAIYWVEYVARHGNVLKSPATYLSWWQLHLLDVWGFILACLAIVIYAVVHLLRKVKKLLFGCNSCPKRSNKSSDSKKKN